MQVQRFDSAGSPWGPRPAQTSGANSRNIGGSGPRENEAEGVAGDSELNELSRQLGGISDIREDVVAMAKVRVQRGDYLTRAAAEKTAAAILSKDA